MSNNNNNIVFASILIAILATSILALNPSTITNAGAQPYGHQYGYDKYPKKSSHTDIQKISCVSSNVNINGIDITRIPQDGIANTDATNKRGTADATNLQNGNGFADTINFEKNLVNICLNVNVNEQVKVSGPQQDQACKGCFATLSVQDRNGFLAIVDAILNSEEIDVEINTIGDLCEFLATSTELTSTEKWQLLNTALRSQGIDQPDTILDCLEDLGIIVEPA